MNAPKHSQYLETYIEKALLTGLFHMAEKEAA